MNPTITTEELLALSKSADLLRQTAEKAMRFDEAERLLTDHVRSWGRLQNAMPDVNDTDTAATPLVERVIQRLHLVDALKEEVVNEGNHAAGRLNLLVEIHRILVSDGGTTGVSGLTGVPPQLYRLPKRIEQIICEMQSARNDRDHLGGILEKVARACDGDDPNITPLDFPQLPGRVAELAKQATQCRHATEQRNQLVRDRDRVAGQRDHAIRERDARENAANDWKGRYHEEVAWSRELLRENETLARNMPPEPSASVFDTPSGAAGHLRGQFNATQPTSFTKVIGQQWCKTDRATTDLVNFAFKFDMQTHYIVLCEVRRDVQTGALTYHPVGVKDLPLVQ